MKWLLAVGGFLLVSVVSAQAQIVGSGGGGGGSIGRATFPSLSSPPATQFNAVVVSGTEQDFVPTTYASYDQMVARGRKALAATPKSLGEVAQEYSREARPKAKLALVQDDHGNAVIARAN